MTVAGPRRTVADAAGRFSRRGFIAVSAALLLGGCRAGAARERPAAPTVLSGLLAAELAAGAAVIDSPVAARLARQDRRHARRLAALAGVPVPPAPAAPVALDTALARKQAMVFAAVDALPALDAPEQRVAVLELLAGEAGQLAALRLAAGAEPVPDAFAGYTEPA